MNPFKKIWGGLKWAGDKAVKGPTFIGTNAIMLEALGVPIPFLKFLKIGMIVAERRKGNSEEKLATAKALAMQLGHAAGMDLKGIDSDTLGVLVKLLLDQEVNAPALKFDVGKSAELADEMDVENAVEGAS